MVETLVESRLQWYKSAATCTEMHAGRLGVVRVDMQGVQALQSNPQVQALYVYLGPVSFEEWAQQQSSRCHCLPLMQQQTSVILLACCMCQGATLG